MTAYPNQKIHSTKKSEWSLWFSAAAPPRIAVLTTSSTLFRRLHILNYSLLNSR